MLFNSLSFAIFFPIVTFLYFAARPPQRCLILLLASFYFYIAFIPAYALILVALILVDFVCGIWIEQAQGEKRRVYLILSLISNLSMLFFFKYFNFFNDNIRSLAGVLHGNYAIPALKIILPLGLSFHTFQSMSYVIEVYRGRQKAERDLGIYALYVMFYPQLVAGPIERPQNLLRQLHDPRDFDYEQVTSGLKLMAWGFFKKLVIADRLALFVNPVYANPGGYSGISLVIATVFFAYQIYCDFSGYSDIAIGAARVMGFRLMKNFDSPYASQSIAEFWRRWHISLSTWFRDYVYIPLGGNRVSFWRWQFNLLLTFLISGLWHGANWTFILWGGLNGFYFIASLWTKDIRAVFTKIFGLENFPFLSKLLRISFTFGLVCFSWIFFRANNLSDASYIVTHLFSGTWNVHAIRESMALMGLTKPELSIILFSIAALETVQWLERRNPDEPLLGAQPFAFRWAAYYAASAVILLFGVFNQSQFIYFQF